MHPIFVKVFDVIDSGFRDWYFAAFGLIFVFIGAINFFAPQIIRLTGIPFLNIHSKWRTFFRYYGLAFGVLWTSIAFFSTYRAYHHHQTMALTNSCQMVEGPVENFNPIPYSGHGEESFSVNGVPFGYSDYVVTDTFNTTSRRGGPLRNDAYVRICYDPDGNQILRLEVRDDKRVGTNPERAEPFVSRPDFFNRHQKSFPEAKVAWYGNLFFLFYLLDFVARLKLFRAYLRTFFVIGRRPLGDAAAPRRGDASETKFEKVVVRHDPAENIIWLRPRGLIFFQIQLVVAKIILDPSGTHMMRMETRFSSGFPVIIALFLWSAYHVFGTTIPAGDGFSVGGFVSIAALAFFFIGYARMKMMATRMGMLVEDWLHELKAAEVAASGSLDLHR